MNKKTTNNIKLGIFVLAGLLFLIILLYMIGRNQNLFGSNFELRARFSNVQGLTSGNNVRYSGIQVGTVKKVKILNDTLIEVVMLIDSKMKQYIRNNAIAAIGTEGLMGNKVVNITPAGVPAPLAEDGNILESKKVLDTDEMLQTLAKTNNDVGLIASELKNTIRRINTSTAAWKILNDNSLPENIRISVANVRSATAKADDMVNDLNHLIKDVKSGKGSLGAILTDTSFAKNLNLAITKIQRVGDDADTLATELKSVAATVRNDINNGKGPVNALLKDSAMVVKINRSLENIQNGTKGFNEVMEGLKHNFLLRGYFRKLERQKQKNSDKISTP